MAKICFLTDRSPTDPDPFSWLMWNQFRVLAESQHDVLVVTQVPPPSEREWQHPKLQVIEPFKSWSLLNLPRLAAILAYHKPDVVHWIEPRTKSISHLQWITPALASLPKRPLLAMSLWDPRRWDKNLLISGTLPSMDIVFVSHPLHRAMLWEKWPRLISRIQVAPLLFDLPPASSHWLTEWAREFDFVPGELADTVNSEELVSALQKTLASSPERQAVIASSTRKERFRFLGELRNRDLDARVAVLENLDWSTWNFLFSNAREIRLEHLDANSPFVSLALQWNHNKPKCIRMTSEQKLILNEIQWQDTVNFLGRAYQNAL